MDIYIWMAMLLQVANDLISGDTATERLSHRIAGHYADHQIWKSAKNIEKHKLIL